MFFQKKSITYIYQNKIRMAKIIHDKPQDIMEFAWTPQTLSQTFTKIKKQYGNKTSILLSDEYIYTATITIPKDTNDLEKSIKEKAEEVIPESLDETTWDFKEIMEIDKDAQTSLKVIQVASLVKSFMDYFGAALYKSNFTVDIIEPLSYTLARLTQNEPKPVVIVYKAEATLLIFAHRGLVIASETIKTALSSFLIEKFIAFVKERFNLAPAKCVISKDSLSDADMQQLKKQEYDIVVEALSPFEGSIASDSAKSRQEKKLTLTKIYINKRELQTAEKQQDSPQNSTAESVHSSSPFNKKIYIVFSVFILIGTLIGLMLFLFPYNQIGKKTKTESFATPTPVITKIPTPIPTPNYQKYTIAVLNGSGKTGEAAKVADLLTKEGFKVTITGNADNQQYETTQVRYKKNVEIEFKLGLDKVLKTIYANYIDELQQSNSEKTDVTLIIGK